MLLLIGSLGMLTLVDASTRNTYRAEQSQVVVNQLQAEMEKIKRIPFTEVALTAAPATFDGPERSVMACVGHAVRDLADGTDMRPLVVERRRPGSGRDGLGRRLSPAADPVRGRRCQRDDPPLRRLDQRPEVPGNAVSRAART